MEEKKEVKTGKVIGIIVIVVAVLAIIGGVCWYIYVEKKNNNAVAQNTVNEVNTEANTDTASNTTDPYANYKDIEWTRTTSINYPATDSNNYSVWIDSSGVIHISDTMNNNTKEEITIDSLQEKAKYIATILSVPNVSYETLVVLTESNNLYIISNYYIANDGYNNDTNMSQWKLNNKPDIVKLTSNILEIYKDNTAQGADNTNQSIPNYAMEIGGGTFVGIYALTSDGKLNSINKDIDTNTGEDKIVLGLPYEDLNSIKGKVLMGLNILQITKDNYLRDSSSIKANYISDSNGNKISVKYLFRIPDTSLDKDGNNYVINQSYVITLDNKIYSISTDPDSSNYQVKLVNDKTVKSINYNNFIITVTYTNNTTEKFNINQDFDISTAKYGF